MVNKKNATLNIKLKIGQKLQTNQRHPMPTSMKCRCRITVNFLMKASYITYTSMTSINVTGNCWCSHMRLSLICVKADKSLFSTSLTACASFGPVVLVSAIQSHHLKCQYLLHTTHYKPMGMSVPCFNLVARCSPTFSVQLTEPQFLSFQ